MNLTGNQVLPGIGMVRLNFDAYEVNGLQEFDIVAHTFTPNQSGLYLFTVNIEWLNATLNRIYTLMIHRNGLFQAQVRFPCPIGVQNYNQQLTKIIYVDNNDVIEARANTSNPAGNIISGDPVSTWFQALRIG